MDIDVGLDMKNFGEIIKQYKDDAESSKQTLHEHKRKLQIYESLEKDYLQEIENLKTEKAKLMNNFDSKICKLEDQLVSAKTKQSEKLQGLERDLVEKEIENHQLKNELKLSVESRMPTSHEYDDKLLEELNKVKSSNDLLQECMDELRIQLTNSEKHVVKLTCSETELNKEVENLKAALDCKREEAREAHNLIQTLQEELLCCKTDLDMMKSKPLDNQTRGNSLFAEVNDRRIQLQKNMDTMKTRYIEMKKERAQHLTEITYLRNEKAKLLQHWERDISDQEKETNLELETHKVTIQRLQEIIEGYKKDLTVKNPKPTEIFSVKEMMVYQGLLNSKQEELQTMREKLETRTVNHIILSRDLAQVKKEMKLWRLKSTQFQNEIELLNDRLENIKLNNQTENGRSDIESAKGHNSSSVSLPIETVVSSEFHIDKSESTSEGVEAIFKNKKLLPLKETQSVSCGIVKERVSWEKGEHCHKIDHIKQGTQQINSADKENVDTEGNCYNDNNSGKSKTDVSGFSSDVSKTSIAKKVQFSDGCVTPVIDDSTSSKASRGTSSNFPRFSSIPRKS